MASYRQIRFGVEKVATGDVPRHVHREGYANVVLSGTFTEASFAGRTRAAPGTVLLHGPFDCHANMEGSGRNPTILRLPWAGTLVEGAFRIADPDLLARLSETDVRGANLALAEMLEPIDAPRRSWVDDLACALKDETIVELRSWAEKRSLNPASVSRGFHEAYGVSPRRFRLEARARLAWRRTVTEASSLTQIAHECSFADLAHMSRSVALLTSASPSAWRRGKAGNLL